MPEGISTVANPIKLNLGAGGHAIPGFTPLDRSTGQEVYPLAYADNSVDEIRASHILEHFSHQQTFNVIREWVRVLKPGGVLRIAVPDFAYIADAYTKQRETPHPIEAYLFGGHMNADDQHGAMFDRDKLEQLMEAAGLREITEWKSEIEDCAAYAVSLNLRGEKPGPRLTTAQPNPLAGVHVVMSAPRLLFADQANCMNAVLHKLRVPVKVAGGVFWDQCLTRLIEDEIRDGAEFIVTMDYDSIFTPEQLVELHRLMRKYPDADAIAALQTGRDRVAPLFTTGRVVKDRTVDIPLDQLAADLLPVKTCHFGLTIIRASSLQRMVKPWFHSRPDKDGGWGEGKTDSDIAFWRNAEASGLKVYQANRVVVGHLQLVATWPDERMQPIHQYLPEWRASGGPPEGVWR